MYKSERYKFGTLTLEPTAQPELATIHQALDQFEAAAPNDNRKYDPDSERITDLIHNSNHGEYAYCHFIYHASAREADIPSDEKSEADNARTWTIRSRIFYFKNGQFAIQSTDGLAKHWLPALFERISNGAIGADYRFYPGGNDSCDNDKQINAQIADATTHCDDANPADLIDATASEIESISEQHDSPPQQSPLPTGGVMTAWPEPNDDLSTTDRAERIFDRLKPYLETHQ
ncbi:hypothetical protein [Halocatena halophila]|uniref:hypothetical protein n=1 Tax=Halocatena halophila TaxID=2814576 RepID=UPI002ED02E57